MIQYRPQKGSLKDSMKEIKEFITEDEMKMHIAREFNRIIPKIRYQDITIVDTVIYDDRIDWEDMHYVMIGERNCVGFCNYPKKKEY